MAKTTTAPRAARIIPILLGLALIAAMAGTTWVGIRAGLAERHLQDAQSIAASLGSDVLLNPLAAAEALTRLRDDTSTARELTSDVVWRLGEGLPWVGPHLNAASTIARNVDEIVAALDPLAEKVGEVGASALAPVDGAYDTAALDLIEPSAAIAAARTEQAANALSSFDESALAPRVQSAMDGATTLASSVARTTDAFARATRLLPLILGAEGPRDYLVLFQNNAEWRSLGGLVGSIALVHTESGRFSLAGQTSASELGRLDDTPIAFNEEVLNIYANRPGRFPGNVTQLPDFALAGQLARAHWEINFGQETDGVVALDPVALSYLLDVTGPVQLPTGDTLTSDNLVPLVLNEVYQRYENPIEQDHFFQLASAAVFDAVTSRVLDPVGLLSALGRAADENRLFIWSALSEEQAILDGTSLQGELPVTDAEATRFGVYVNDGTGSKMDYYARLDTNVEWCGQNQSGNATAALRVTIANEAPLNAASALSPSIHGDGNFGVPPGMARTVTYIYLPQGANIASSQASESRTVGSAVHDGREVIVWTVDLLPGSSATFDVAVTTPFTDQLDVIRTPTLHANKTENISNSCSFAQY